MVPGDQAMYLREIWTHLTDSRIDTKLRRLSLAESEYHHRGHTYCASMGDIRPTHSVREPLGGMRTPKVEKIG